MGQLVVVLVDALRADFVYTAAELSSAGVDFAFKEEEEERPKIDYLRRMLSSGDGFARGFASQASPPTVTLPRLKALATGGIPGFADVVLNFGSSELREDSIVRQWEAAGR